MDDVRQALTRALNEVERTIADAAREWDRMSPSDVRSQLWTKLRDLMKLREAIEKLLPMLPPASPGALDTIGELDAISAENERIAARLPHVTNILEKIAEILTQARKIDKALKTLTK